MKFAYQAINAQGEKISGTLEAQNRQEVLNMLQQSGCLPIQVQAQATPWWARSYGRQGVKGEHLAMYAEELATLLDAKMSLDKALALLSTLTASPALQEATREMRRMVKEGMTFSQALQSYPKLFPPLMSSMVYAGEESGNLATLMSKMAHFLGSMEQSRQQLKSSMTYPSILFAVGLGSVVVLMTYVVPQFANVFSDMGQAPPASTQALLSLSAWMQTYIAWIGGALAGVILVWHFWRQSRQGQLTWHRWQLAWPLFGSLIWRIELARLANTLAVLLAGGVPLLKALQISRQVIGNTALNQAWLKVEQGVREGSPLTQALTELAQDFRVSEADTLIHFSAIGEESGQLAPLLGKAAHKYEREVEREIKHLVSLVEPSVIIGIGLLVGAVVVSMLSAVFSLTNIQV
ncbi:general secretion pathway protein F [Allopseudospirillum japonicum]|uniref:General secretion pathway protein F n=1 Tax=Allopseudospirillum japonicum TaxID=64971 RepID=A0A1H6SR70_9GAMM|nr:type II secretion system F family protein [Allopseudospirillum japonicum]SEI67277.1 general secretion pathway protein F [Allopseudospirillum japonicum]